ncbi:MAG: hypothetical protein JSV89_20605 [Spirochaetaceae bacterium]|nr:MAG: hypothetical protein JSV89_20605 [Spirochaetaceae bacterium]
MSQRTGGTPKAAGSGALESLLAFDSLEVGPVQLEKRRLLCPYRISTAGQGDSYQLIYSYEEPVFDPKEACSRNLAAMIAAQISLNYALFCRQIRFRGCFDATDRTLLREMAENTAREIYVNKILAPNRFITGLAELPPVSRGPYSQARLEFDDSAEDVKGGSSGIGTANAVGTSGTPNVGNWDTNLKRYAVLSSGGKESLLSYGLLEELAKKLGLEAHPIFVNESGRHWFTALNAYRYFNSIDGKTARVWTNSDRLFNWFLRHLPFVRSDFARLRTDYYPIRLWTVAVFAFGALPLLRKRGIAHLVIGDEYDTTQKGSHRGIPHYHGLYDQSRWFDIALSRYYKAKGWAVCQLSLLRPLSELLIEKVLVERYPDLQRFQMSCHAAHVDGGQVVPCGACEKCRRIIGMLTALEADPRRCGFRAEQIRRNLATINGTNLHQEQAGVQHLLYLLGKTGHGSPEVMKLRFDPQASPLEDYPKELRNSLIRILLDHAEGTLHHDKDSWRDFQPSTSMDSG